MYKLILFVSLFICTRIVALEPVIIVLGPPGCGKGNLSQFFKENYHYNHLGAGDLVRREIQQKTPMGLQIAEIVKRGEYIDSQIMHFLMNRAVGEFVEQEEPFIIDGFGGTDQDMKFLHALLSSHGLLPKTFVLFLDADDSVCAKRMSQRLICSQCEQIYNTDTVIPKVEGMCDLCSGELVQRSNDTPELISKRLKLYRQRVEPNYMQALEYFPCLFIRTDASLEDCQEVYTNLAIHIGGFQGNADEFVDQTEKEVS